MSDAQGTQALVGEGTVTGFGDNANRDIVCNMLGPDGISMTWEIGDQVVLGVPPDMTLRTQFVPFSENKNLDSIKVEYSLSSRFSNEISLPQLAWMDAQLIDSEGTIHTVTTAEEGTLEPGPRYLGFSNLDPSGLVVREPRVGSSTRSAAVQLRFMGAGQVRLSQISMELVNP